MFLSNLFNKDQRKIKSISYFGFADATPPDSLYTEAFECAKFMAGKNFVTINGGGPGLMRATSEGAKAVGGKTVGATFFPKNITNFEGRDKNNPLDKEIRCSSYLERTLKLLELGDVYIIFKGGTGTISEFGMAWGLARLYFGHHKPLILYGDFWNEVTRSFISNMRIRSEETKVYKIVTTPEEAYQAILIFENALKEQVKANGSEKAFQL